MVASARLTLCGAGAILNRTGRPSPLQHTSCPWRPDLRGPAIWTPLRDARIGAPHSHDGRTVTRPARRLILLDGSTRALPLVCALLGVFPLAITAPAYAGPSYGTVAVNGVTYELPPSA